MRWLNKQIVIILSIEQLNSCIAQQTQTLDASYCVILKLPCPEGEISYSHYRVHYVTMGFSFGVLRLSLTN